MGYTVTILMPWAAQAWLTEQPVLPGDTSPQVTTMVSREQ